MLKEEVPWIETISGRYVNPLNLQDSDICIEDIAQPLSQICRFNGQCSRFYSVGQHSIHVADMVGSKLLETYKEGILIPEHNRTCLAALLHDASEAYTNDINRPVKYAVKGFKEIDNIITGKIMKHFGCVGADWDLIKKMDNVMLATEAYSLMKSKGEGWYLPEPRSASDIPESAPGQILDIFMKKFYKFGGR